MQPSRQPLVSCVIPCYNRARYAAIAVESALSQTYPNVEIVVVDDGSTDSTAATLECTFGDRIRLIRQTNAGTAAARNTGISASSGEYVAWLDSDDAWLPQKIEAQVAVAEAHADVALVYTLCLPMDAHGNPPSINEPIAVPDAVIRRDILRMLVVESEVLTPSCLVRRSALDAVGLFDPAYSAEDWELNFRLAMRYPFAYIDAPLTRHRIHPATKTADRWAHALGLLKLRERIEAARGEATAIDPSPEMRTAYARHDLKYADAAYRVGRLALDRGETAIARRLLADAVRRNPRVFKHHTRLWKARIATMFTRGGGPGVGGKQRLDNGTEATQ